LRKSVEGWHDAAVRAERNAAMSQDESMQHLDRIAELEAENERLRAQAAKPKPTVPDFARIRFK